MNEQNKFWNERTKRLIPYVPGEQPRGQTFIKLNTNENPYPPAPGVESILRSVDPSELRLYPDPTCLEPRQAIAENYGLAAEQVFMGNGSDEVLALAFAAFFKRADEGGLPIIFPEITYSFYPVYANLFEIDFQTPVLQEDFSICIEDYLVPSGGVVLANPNAPTGVAVNLADLRRIAEYDPDRLVIVDEAYADFSTVTAIDLLAECPNILVIRTFSKSYSLAGLRIGFALGAPQLIEALCRVRDSYNSYTVGVLSQKAATAAIKDRVYFQKTRDALLNTRTKTSEALRELGCELNDSQTNFLWVKIPGFTGAEIYTALRNEGILVRYFNNPKTQFHVRITVGTDEEMAALVQVIAKIIKDRRKP